MTTKNEHANKGILIFAAYDRSEIHFDRNKCKTVQSELHIREV